MFTTNAPNFSAIIACGGAAVLNLFLVAFKFTSVLL